MWKLLHRARGDNPLPLAADLERRQWLSGNELARWQEARLVELLEHAYDRVPLYRQRLNEAFGGRPSAPLDWHRFRQLKVLGKDELRSRGGELLTLDPRRLTAGRTSGSTGVPTKVWFEPSYLAYVWGVQRRALNWFGIEPWDRTFYFGGPQHGFSRRAKQKLLDIATGRVVRASLDLSPPALTTVLRHLRRFRPKFLTGYANALYQLIHHAEQSGAHLDDLGIRLIMPCSEQVHDYYDAAFARVLGCPIAQEYGCVEVGAMAYRCPQGTMHISHDHVLLELLDEHDRPAAVGQQGRVVLTPLMNFATPLLRYNLGDLAVLGAASCPCGRFPGLPTLDSITGRTMDHIVDREGRHWHSVLLFYAFKYVHDTNVFQEFQGTQCEPGKVRVLIVPGPAFKPEHAERYVQVVRESMQGAVEVTWEIVAHIERQGSGKLKYFLSTVEPSQQQLQVEASSEL
jgi:phenylacetate-CoA ligase